MPAPAPSAPTPASGSTAETAWHALVEWWPTNPIELAAITMLAGLVLAFGLALLLRLVLPWFTRRTQTELDDKVVSYLYVPVIWSVLAAAAIEAFDILAVPKPFPFILRGLVVSGVVISWALAGWAIVADSLAHAQAGPVKGRWVQSSTLPVLRIGGQGFVLAASAYFLFLGWDLDLTGWLASAGVLGLVVGFAAQETVGNMFAGVAILIGGTYRIGDVLTLLTGERGRVVEIGMRTTRIVTLENVDIVVPNSRLANDVVRNESVSHGTRIAAKVGVAYGTDADIVAGILAEVGHGVPGVLPLPAPEVIFMGFGPSSLDFELRVWIDYPDMRDPVTSELNHRIYRRFTALGIEIPFQRVDVTILQPDAES